MVESLQLEQLDLRLSRWENFLPAITSNSVDLVLIDPPYGISRKTGLANGGVERFRMSYEFGDWDNPVRDELWDELYRILRKGGTIVTFCDLWNLPDLHQFKMKRFAEWIKTNPVPINSKRAYLSNCREAIISAVKGSNPTFNGAYDNGVYSYPINHEKGRFHPTQKPLALIEELIRKHSNEDDLVLDCFSGSGTTAVACLKTNRRFVGCEVNEEYFSQSVDRIKNLKEAKND